MIKHIKKAFLLLLSFILCLSVLNMPALAERYEYYYYREEDGGAVITGYVPGISGLLIIPAVLGDLPVYGVDDWAFAENSGVKSLKIEEGVRKIGDNAFSGCVNLKSISLPDSLIFIGWDAFSYCSALESVTIPGNVTAIGGFAFCDCVSLHTVEFISGNTNIRASAFEGCARLTDIYYPLKKAGRVNMTVESGNGDFKEALWHYEKSETGIKPGDINGDGALNNKDLTRLFKYLSDWEVDVVPDALDVNGDGSVNNRDLTRLFQYLSDWEVEIY